jgi:hypothetical protein
MSCDKEGRINRRSEHIVAHNVLSWRGNVGCQPDPKHNRNELRLRCGVSTKALGDCCSLWRLGAAPSIARSLEGLFTWL